jgi:hypothetical protein
MRVCGRPSRLAEGGEHLRMAAEFLQSANTASSSSRRTPGPITSVVSDAEGVANSPKQLAKS